MTYSPYTKYVDSASTIDFLEEEWNCELVEPDNPVLHKPAATNPFSMINANWPEREKEMFALMHNKLGVGLSANQVGCTARMFVMNHSHLGNIGIYNPSIIETSDQEVVVEEGCLTWPLLFIKKSRPDRIKVTWTKNDGETRVETWMDGMDARCFQHELDHLQGLTFLEGESDFKLKRAKQKRDKLFKKLQRQK